MVRWAPWVRWVRWGPWARLDCRARVDFPGRWVLSVRWVRLGPEGLLEPRGDLGGMGYRVRKGCRDPKGPRDREVGDG